MKKLLAVTWWLSAALVAWAPSALAQSPAEERVLRRGVDLRREGRDQEALELFRQVWESSRAPRARAQMGLAEQALGRWLLADEHLREALSAATDAWIIARRPVLEASLATVALHVGGVEVTSPAPGAELFVRGQRVGALPLRSPLRLEVGVVAMEVRAPGHQPLAREVSVAPGTTRAEVFALAPLVDPRSLQRALSARVLPPPPRRTPALRYVGYGALGVGVALLSVGVVQWVRSALQWSASTDPDVTDPDQRAWVVYQDLVNPANAGGVRVLTADLVCDRARADGRSLPEIQTVRESCDANDAARTMALAFGVAGLAVAGAGVAMVLLSPSRARAPSVTVTPVVGAGLGGATLGVAF